jgi:hypothetical protein
MGWGALKLNLDMVNINPTSNTMHCKSCFNWYTLKVREFDFCFNLVEGFGCFAWALMLF